MSKLSLLVMSKLSLLVDMSKLPLSEEMLKLALLVALSYYWWRCQNSHYCGGDVKTPVFSGDAKIKIISGDVRTRILIGNLDGCLGSFLITTFIIMICHIGMQIIFINKIVGLSIYLELEVLVICLITIYSRLFFKLSCKTGFPL